MTNGRKTILVCDDEEQLAYAIGATLDRLGYDAEVRTDSYESLRAFAENPMHYDLAIIDQSMPRMTGLDLARRISSIRPDFPVVLFTGSHYLISEDAAKAAGVLEIHEKPLTRPDLSDLLERLVGGA